MDRWGTTAGIAACGLLAVLASATPSAAQIYKWVDASGTVHFGNNPPAPVTGAPAVEQVPEGDSRPLVRNGPPPPEDEPAPPEHEAAEPPEDEATDGSRNSASDPAQDDAAPDTVVVQDGVRDPATALRATSPRNRPGEPIRQPNLQPIRPARRGP